MNKSPKHHYSREDFWTLRSLYKDYLEHRLGHQVPHTTFKRYLVAKNKRFYCDFFDDYRHGRTQFPSIWSEEMTYAFSAYMRNEGWWGGSTHLQRIR